MNRLHSEKSPYLLQHAGNPVDWYPWGAEAFEKARREEKPIFLSIGYSTCHWCHVMAHESFEDAEIAGILNRHFIAVKVDREERPDLDNLYMSACRIVSGGGGWPLSIFLTPDLKPFYAGTYFPKESRFGRMGFRELLLRINVQWTNRRSALLAAAARIESHLQQGTFDGMKRADGEPDVSTLHEARDALFHSFDKTHGGFGGAPKFPTPHHFFFLLRYWKRSGDRTALEMVEQTLSAMRFGGIYDQVGFGFHRYSVDDRWFTPHFEKMLYDQALLAMAYAETYQETGKPVYAKTVEEIFTYILRDMKAPEGGFYSGEDADSEGVEGKFYLWKADEIRQVLDNQNAELWIKVFNAKEDGNFPEGARGQNLFHLQRDIRELAREFKMSEDALASAIEDSRSKLLRARERRIRPLRDDKILTDWNGIMIAAMAKGSQALDRRDYALTAKRAADFLLAHLRTPEGRLLHRYREGEAAVPAFLDDYAFLIWGLIELYEAVFDAAYLEAALALNETVFRHFWDSRGGLYYFSADDGEALLVRGKECFDGAIPSGNSVMALNLLRLGRMTGNSDLENRAAEMTRAYCAPVEQTPNAFSQFLSALDFGLGPTGEVVIAGNPHHSDTKALLKALRKPFFPNTVVLLLPTDEPEPTIARLAPFLSDFTSHEGKAAAYVCRAQSCRAPTTDKRRMLKLLSD
jgi:hypothetical protein